MRIETIGKATLYLGDCREILPAIEGVTALISDPPYGVSLNTRTASSARHRGTAFGLKRSVDAQPIIGDDEPFDPSPLLAYDKVILWGANHYADSLPSASKWLIWDKRCGGTPDDNADCEMAWTNLPGPARIHRQVWRGFFRQGIENAAISGEKLHPAQKPVALMQWCIRQLRATHDTICDPYLGSGTTGIAAVSAEHSFVGIEIDPRYFDIACKRIEDAQRQVNMFATATMN